MEASSTVTVMRRDRQIRRKEQTHTETGLQPDSMKVTSIIQIHVTLTLHHHTSADQKAATVVQIIVSSTVHRSRR